MKKHFFLIAALFPIVSFGQLSETLLKKIKYATDEFYIANDTLNITGSNTLPCVQVTINGKGRYHFLIDLGSNVVNFKQSVVEETGMEIVVDRESGDIAVARKIQLGNSVFINVHGAVYEDLDLDGVLGFNLIGKSNFMIDYPIMKFAFILEPENLGSKELTEYELLDRLPYLKTTLGTKEIFINFDTGASGWLYFPISFKDSVSFVKPLKKGDKSWNNQTGYAQTFIGQINESFNFGNYIIESPFVIFEPDIDDIIVGSSLLNDFKLSFFVDKKMVGMERVTNGKKINIPMTNKKNINTDMSIANEQMNELNKSSFDFWVGKWNIHYYIKDSVKVSATNEITKILDGKVIKELFKDPTNNFKGTSISVFNSNTKTWHQAWADNQGGYYNFVGSKVNDKYIFQTLPEKKEDKIIILRMVFHSISADYFIWDWEKSEDNGETWTLKWQLFYNRF